MSLCSAGMETAAASFFPLRAAGGRSGSLCSRAQGGLRPSQSRSQTWPCRLPGPTAIESLSGFRATGTSRAGAAAVQEPAQGPTTELLWARCFLPDSLLFL